MSNTQDYVRSIESTGSFVIGGIGTTPDLVAYDVGNQADPKSILPETIKTKVGTTKDFCQVYASEDGNLSANIYTDDGLKFLKIVVDQLEGIKVTVIDQREEKPSPIRMPRLAADNRKVFYDYGKVTLEDNDGLTNEYTVAYPGRNLHVHRIGIGPHGVLYGSTLGSLRFFKIPDTEKWEEISPKFNPPDGEIYSMLCWKDKLICGVYSMALGPIMIYDPQKPWLPGTEKETNNPWTITYDGQDMGWRPTGIVASADGNQVYIGAIAGYGASDGLLCILDPENGKVEQLNIVAGQGIYSLAALPDGRIVGGSTCQVGPGAHTTEREAKIFIWTPSAAGGAEGVKTLELVPVPRKSQIDALCVGQDGKVYGIAGDSLSGSLEYTLFCFNPNSGEVVNTANFTDFGSVVYNALGVATGGKLIGLCQKGIFEVKYGNPGSNGALEILLLVEYSSPIDGGFAIRGKRIYFTSGPQILSYELPG